MSILPFPSRSIQTEFKDSLEHSLIRSELLSLKSSQTEIAALTVEPWWLELRKDVLESELLVLMSMLKVLVFLALFFIQRDFPVCFRYFLRSCLSAADGKEGTGVCFDSSIAWVSTIDELVLFRVRMVNTRKWQLISR